MSRLSTQLHTLRRLAALLAALLLCAALLAPAAAAQSVSGECGDLAWSLSGGVLTITGKGAIPNFTEATMSPWYEYRETIREVRLDDGITAVGDLAFYGCTALVTVKLPDAVRTVGEMAFSECRSLVQVTMPKVTEIKRHAFSHCYALSAVSLPNTLTTIGYGAFYRCESLRSVLIPASVRQMGGSVFAYCAAMITARVDAPLEILPEWIFYGCTSLKTVTLSAETGGAGADAFSRCELLETVYYDGTEEQQQTLAEDIADGLPSFVITQITPTPDAVPPAEKTEIVTKGEVDVETSAKLTETEHADIQSQVTVERPIKDGVMQDKVTEAQITVDAVIRAEDGWHAVIAEVDDQIVKQSGLKVETGKSVPLTVNASLMDGSMLSGEVLKSLAGKDVTLNIVTPDGSRWSILCKQLKGLTFKKQYDMSYTTALYEQPSDDDKRILGGATSYRITFADKIDFPASVCVYLGADAFRQTATLFEDGPMQELKKLQSIKVSESGIASFRMANINEGTQYIVALNVVGIAPGEVFLPDDIAPEYAQPEEYVPITDQYIVTDVRGFLGLTMGQFTTIVLWVVGGFVFVVVAIGAVVWFAGKKKGADAVLYGAFKAKDKAKGERSFPKISFKKKK